MMGAKVSRSLIPTGSSTIAKASPPRSRLREGSQERTAGRIAEYAGAVPVRFSRRPAALECALHVALPLPRRMN